MRGSLTASSSQSLVAYPQGVSLARERDVYVEPWSSLTAPSSAILMPVSFIALRAKSAIEFWVHSARCVDGQRYGAKSHQRRRSRHRLRLQRVLREQQQRNVDGRFHRNN